jgi:membrane-associated phospholipid phosphatase
MRGRIEQLVRRRLDPDQRLGLRLTLGFLGVLVIALPFLLLWLLIEDNWSPLHRVDRGAASHLNNAVYDHPVVVDVLKAISFGFGPNTFRVVGVLVMAYLLFRRHIRLAAFVAVGIFGGALIDGIAKTLAGRHRPVLAHPITHAPGQSFPSGHAMGSLVGAGVLLLVFLPLLGRTARRVALVFAVLVVAAVGFSRVALGVHYVSDVIGGWVLGAAWLLVTTAAFAIWRRETGKPVHLEQGLEPESAPDLSMSVGKSRNVRRTAGRPTG